MTTRSEKLAEAKRLLSGEVPEKTFYKMGDDGQPPGKYWLEIHQPGAPVGRFSFFDPEDRVTILKLLQN